jgi:hypothetical protein
LIETRRRHGSEQKHNAYNRCNIDRVLNPFSHFHSLTSYRIPALPDALDITPATSIAPEYARLTGAGKGYFNLAHSGNGPIQLRQCLRISPTVA